MSKINSLHLVALLSALLPIESVFAGGKHALGAAVTTPSNFIMESPLFIAGTIFFLVVIGTRAALSTRN